MLPAMSSDDFNYSSPTDTDIVQQYAALLMLHKPALHSSLQASGALKPVNHDKNIEIYSK